MAHSVEHKLINYIGKKLEGILEDVESYTNNSINAHFKCGDYSKEDCRMNFIKGNLIKYQISKLIEKIEIEKETKDIFDEIYG